MDMNEHEVSNLVRTKENGGKKGDSPVDRTLAEGTKDRPVIPE